MSQKLPISQSNLKELLSYLEYGECGVYSLLRMTGVEGRTSDAMNLGSYFEFLLTGARPKHGKIPRPVRLKPEKGSELGALNSDYQFAEDSVETWNKWMKDIYGFEFDKFENGKKRVSVDLKIQNWKGTGRDVTGTLDSIMIATRDVYTFNYEYMKAAKQSQTPIIKAGDRVIVDTKFSGLVGDVKDPLGWHPMSLAEKILITTQAKHYKYLYREIYGQDIHFLFTVMSSNKKKSPYFFYINVSDEAMNEHVKNIFAANKIMEKFDSGEVYPRPSMEKCSDCVYREYEINGEAHKCKFAVDHPYIYEIQL
jgi:hypothetical protein